MLVIKHGTTILLLYINKANVIIQTYKLLLLKMSSVVCIYLLHTSKATEIIRDLLVSLAYQVARTSPAAVVLGRIQ